MLKVNGVVMLPAMGNMAAVPSVGVPEHGMAPVPKTATDLVVARPPPDMLIYSR